MAPLALFVGSAYNILLLCPLRASCWPRSVGWCVLQKKVRGPRIFFSLLPSPRIATAYCCQLMTGRLLEHVGPALLLCCGAPRGKYQKFEPLLHLVGPSFGLALQFDCTANMLFTRRFMAVDDFPFTPNSRWTIKIQQKSFK